MLELDSKERKSLAKTFRVCFRGLAETLKDPPYNYGFHLAPPKMKSRDFHWHLEVYPVVAIHAGFEKFNMYLNVTPPEIAAKTLRKTIRKMKFKY